MKNSIMIREIRIIRYFINEFIILNIYIFRLINNRIKMIKIIMKIYLIYNLKVKLLVNINVLDSEEMNICEETSRLHESFKEREIILLRAKL